MPRDDEDLEAEDEFDLLGGMKTHVYWDNASKSAVVEVKQSIASSNNVRLRYRGMLVPSRGAHCHDTTLQKLFYTNIPSYIKLNSSKPPGLQA